MYDTFTIADEVECYSLTPRAYRNTRSAGDSLSQHNAMQFSTRDKDNDDSPGHCAESHTFHGCYSSHLNGYSFYGPDERYYLGYF